MDKYKKQELIERLAHSLDITPDMYNMAMRVVGSLETFLRSKQANTEVYKQGSFKLGTIVKPCKKDKDGEFDIDLVVQFPGNKSNFTPSMIKAKLGEYLKEDSYREFLDEEGKRCWTLNFKSRDGKNVRFHIDMLPCVIESDAVKETLLPTCFRNTAIALTSIEDKNQKPYSYKWGTSNPKGFATWFDNLTHGEKYGMQKMEDRKRVYSQNRHLFESFEKVGDDYTRTPLQMVVQILKRHRDVMYANKETEDFKPISIILTTLAGRIVEENKIVENNTYELLNTILKGFEFYSSLQNSGITSDFADEYKTKQLISKKMVDGKAHWSIKNPADSGENLADKWNKSPQYATEFFRWVRQAQTDLVDIMELKPEEIKAKIKLCLGEDIANSVFGDFVFEIPREIDSNTILPKPYRM